MKPFTRYKALSESEEKMSIDPSLERRPSKNEKSYLCRLLYLILISLAAIGIALWIIVSETSSQSNSTQRRNCGNSSIEAKDLDCEFDIVGATWLPRSCFDKATSDEFKDWLVSDQRFTPWAFFEDDTGNRRVPDVEALSRMDNQVVWTTFEYHLGHCAYTWRRMHRSMGTRKWPDVWSTPFAHTIHCTNMLLDSGSWVLNGSIDTALKVTFGSC